MATKTHVTVIQGDDPEITLVVTEAGLPQSLAGKQVVFMVKTNAYDDDVDALWFISSAGVDPKITITNEAGGVAVANLTDHVEDWGTWTYRAFIASSADMDVDRQTFNYGVFIVKAA